MFGNVWECLGMLGMFGNVRECLGMFGNVWGFGNVWECIVSERNAWVRASIYTATNADDVVGGVGGGLKIVCDLIMCCELVCALIIIRHRLTQMMSPWASTSRAFGLMVASPSTTTMSSLAIGARVF